MAMRGHTHIPSGPVNKRLNWNWLRWCCSHAAAVHDDVSGFYTSSAPINGRCTIAPAPKTTSPTSDACTHIVFNAAAQYRRRHADAI